MSLRVSNGIGLVVFAVLGVCACVGHTPRTKTAPAGGAAADAPVDASGRTADSTTHGGAEATDIAPAAGGGERSITAADRATSDGWFATQTVSQRPYSGKQVRGGWHSTTLALDHFPTAASADAICAATLTGYAFVIETVDTPWPVKGMHVKVVEGGSTSLERDFIQTSPGVWVVEFADTPIPIEDTEISERVLHVEVTQAADYDGTSIVTLMARLEGIEGCEREPRLRSASAPGWDGAVLGDKYLLGWSNFLRPADVRPGPTDVGVVHLSAGSLGWYSTGTSANPRCGEVKEVWASLERRGGTWRPTSMTATLQDKQGRVMRTMVLEEVAPDRWRAIPWPAIAVGVNTRLSLQFSAEEEGERDRFMFRHYWLETGPLSACP